MAADNGVWGHNCEGNPNNSTWALYTSLSTDTSLGLEKWSVKCGNIVSSCHLINRGDVLFAIVGIHNVSVFRQVIAVTCCLWVLYVFHVAVVSSGFSSLLHYGSANFVNVCVCWCPFDSVFLACSRCFWGWFQIHWDPDQDQAVTKDVDICIISFFVCFGKYYSHTSWP